MIKNIYLNPRVNITSMVNIKRLSLRFKKKDAKMFVIKT